MDVPFLKVALGTSILALLFAIYLVRYVLSKPQGNAQMEQLSKAIQDGALAFLKREYVWVSTFCIIISLCLVGIGVVKPELGLNWKTAIAFIGGALASACEGIGNRTTCPARIASLVGCITKHTR